MKSTFTVLVFIVVSHFVGAQTANYWVKKSDFGSDTIGNGLKRERAVAFTIDDVAYVGTGVDTAEQTKKDFWKYDDVLDSWSQVADLPGSQRRNAIAFSIGGYGYVGTGMDSTNASAPGSNTLSDFWQYNPTTNSWLQKANYPGAFGGGIYFATGFAIDSKGYVCGGKRGPNLYSSELWEYKPTLDQWTQLLNFPGGVRYQLSSFVIGFKAYVGLGTDQDMYRKDIWEFDASLNQWFQKSDLPASERGSAMTFTIGQRGYVCMGTNGGLLDDLWEYNPFSDSWSSRENYGGSERKNAVAFTVNGKGYVGTGNGYSGKKASFQEYYPPEIVGMDELTSELFVYPNPAENVINISTNTILIERYEVYSSYGSMVISSESTSQINVEHLSPGIYILAGIDNSGQTIAKQKLFIR